MKYRKAPGKNGIASNLFKEAEVFSSKLIQLFIQWIRKKKLFQNSYLGKETLLYKRQ